MGLRIDLLANDGSPIGVTPADIDGRGVGGAELAMMSLCQVLGERGHEVRVYNDPAPGEVVGQGGVRYLPRRAWEASRRRDAVIIFRSPTTWTRWRGTARLRHIWWSCDQYTIGDFARLGREVDLTVCISHYHRQHHLLAYGLDPSRTFAVDLGVRTWEYPDAEEVLAAKVPGRLIYCSVPGRGLDILAMLWPAIRSRVPDASLVITSDYRLWGARSARDAQHRLNWVNQEGVCYLGAVPRPRLIEEQCRAEIQAYPCIYEELFCLAAAECQVAGALPVTTGAAALLTTNAEGIIIPGDPFTPPWQDAFVGRIAALLTTEREYLRQRQRAAMAVARGRFDWHRIASHWESLITEGRLATTGEVEGAAVPE